MVRETKLGALMLYLQTKRSPQHIRNIYSLPRQQGLLMMLSDSTELSRHLFIRIISAYWPSFSIKNLIAFAKCFF